MFQSSFVALLFVLLIIVVVFLGFQVQENSSRCKDNRLSDQNELKQVTRLMLQADSQSNPFWKYRHALESKIRMDQLLQSHGSVTSAAKTLKVDGGRLEQLRKRVEGEVEVAEEIMNELVTHVNDRFSNEFTPEAGLASSNTREVKRRRGG